MSAHDLASRFPPDFTFGVATAAFQIEGAVREGGRGPSIWDAFSHMPGRVYRGDTGDVACDHYHRMDEDLDLIAALGVDAYRFSIAWPRVLPLGRGPVNEVGLAFYDRLFDGIKARGLKAFATLYHWDLPLALMGYGGWTDRDTADAFADYTSLIVRRFGDRIDALATHNEPWCATFLGHHEGIHAPGERNLEATLRASHVMNLAHGKSVLAARAERADIPMGIVLNSHSTYAGTDKPEDKAAAERFFDFHNGIFLDPIFKGQYPASLIEAHGDLIGVKDGDLQVIRQPLDWWGYNYYLPVTIVADTSPDAAYPAATQIPSTQSNHRTDIGWEVKSAGLTHHFDMVYDRYDLPPCYITENGAAYNMGPDGDGAVNDQPRLDYLADHIGKAGDAIAAGIPLKGYFAWSLMDNFEWAEGYKMRFGIVHVDYETQKRTIKNSGRWYRELVSAHRKG